MASVLNNIGASYDKLHRWDLAFEFYERALEKYDPKDPRRAAPLDNKGELYAALNNPDKAQECYLQALEALTKAGNSNPDLKANILVHQGQLSMGKGEYEIALRHFDEAQRLPVEKYRLAYVYTNMGAAFAAQGQ